MKTTADESGERAHHSLFSERLGQSTMSGRKSGGDASHNRQDTPLIIALHGGTYSSAYFDVPGYSLLDRASALGLTVIAIDRPGYGNTTPLAPHDATIANNARSLDAMIGEIWQRYASDHSGVFLIGHSIGGAITVSIAAREPSWPLVGIAVSGVGLVTPEESLRQWSALPDTAMIELPGHLKDQVMFGPDWTFANDMPALSHTADAPVPRAELIDIVSTWHASVADIASKVRVPVHYRQGEFDRLWIADADQVAGFRAVFTASPRVDAALCVGAGHCIDFHRLGAAFQLEQLSFALRCAVQHASQ